MNKVSFDTLIVGLALYIQQKQPYPYPVALQHGLNDLALYLGEQYPKTLPEFLTLMRQPIQGWYQGALPEGLYAGLGILDGEQLEEPSLDYLLENELSDIQSVQEIVWRQDNQLMQALWKQARADFADLQNQASQIEQDYGDARSYVIIHPFTTLSHLRRALRHNKYLNQVQEMYEDVLQAGHRLHYDNASYWNCPLCGPIQKDVAGQGKSLKPSACAGRCPTQSGWKKCDEIASLFVIKSGIQWRTMIPGVAEIELYHWLYNPDSKQPNYEALNLVRLYPAVDRYDIQLKFSDDEVWAVDVKDYRKPQKLGKAISPKALPDDEFAGLKWDKAFYVIPDYREVSYPGYCDAVRNQANLHQFPNIDILTDDQFRQAVERKLWELT